MPLSRRTFAAAVLATSATSSVRAAMFRQPKRLLVLGGTHFVGPAVVQRALDHGHQVTLFNRGKTAPGLFPHLEHIAGDRDPASENLSGLAGNRRWDAVIDVWPSDPRVAEATGRLLRDRVDRYIYVSSISAYKDLAHIGTVESDPLFDNAADKSSWYEFGKAESERRLQMIYGERFSSVRPPIIAGWRQDSDSFRFWAVRIARGGDVLSPGDGSDPVQFTDVKDIGAFVIAIAEQDLSGPFNAIGPARRLTFKGFLDELNRASGDRAKLVWIDRDFLTKQGISSWTNLPMWRPIGITRWPGFMQLDSGKAIAAGLSFRPIAATARDERRWFARSMPASYQFGTEHLPGEPVRGLSPARERQALEAWRRRTA